MPSMLFLLARLEHDESLGFALVKDLEGDLAGAANPDFCAADRVLTPHWRAAQAGGPPRCEWLSRAPPEAGSRSTSRSPGGVDRR
jgi:hypothetical protein